GGRMPALGASRDSRYQSRSRSRPRPHSLAVRSAGLPAQAAQPFFRLRAPLRGLSSPASARARLLRLSGARGRSYRRRTRHEDGPGRAAAADSEMDLDGEAAAADAARGDRGGTAFLRAVPAGAVN